MEHAFFVTSSIEVDPTKPFKGVLRRTAFSTDQRLNQTFHTLKNLKEKDPIAPIYLIDSSLSYFQELDNLPLDNFHYIRLQDLNSIVADTVRTYPSKSYCECLMILEFLKHYKQELKKYDYITKVCGRYILGDNYSTKIFKSFPRKDKFFMKKELVWQGKDINFLDKIVLPHDLLLNGKLYGFYTVAHALGSNKLDHYETFMAASAQMQTEQGKYFHQDVEYTLHYYIRLFNMMKDVEIVNWTVDGFCGITGKGVRY